VLVDRAFSFFFFFFLWNLAWEYSRGGERGERAGRMGAESRREREREAERAKQEGLVTRQGPEGIDTDREMGTQMKLRLSMVWGEEAVRRRKEMTMPPPWPTEVSERSE